METTQAISSFAELMAKYGVPIVISAAVLFLFIWMIWRDKKLIDKMTKPSADMSNVIIGKVTEVLEESLTAQHPNAEEANKRDVIDREMHLLLKGLIKHTASDRAFVYLYHNGGKSYSGFSFTKMSCLSEAVIPGINPVSKENQQIQRGSFTDMITELKEHGEFFIPSTENTSIDPIIRDWCTSRASRACYMRSFKDHQGYVIGFLGIDYVSTHDMPSEEKIRARLAEASVAVASLVLAGTYVTDFNADKIVPEK